MRIVDNKLLHIFSVDSFARETDFPFLIILLFQLWQSRLLCYNIILDGSVHSSLLFRKNIFAKNSIHPYLIKKKLFYFSYPYI